MKIYSIEKDFYDGCDNESDCVCSTVSLDVVLDYIRNNPLDDCCYHYYVTIFDGFTGKKTHRGVVCYNHTQSLKEIKFEALK